MTEGAEERGMRGVWRSVVVALVVCLGGVAGAAPAPGATATAIRPATIAAARLAPIPAAPAARLIGAPPPRRSG